MATGVSVNHKYQFVSELDDALKCLICKEVAEEPWQHGECKKLLCKKCLEQHGKNEPCPHCKSSNSQYFKDPESKRKIKALRVKCYNFHLNCEWVGSLSTLKKHSETCKYNPHPCPKQCKNDQNEVNYFPKRDMGFHLETYCPNRDYYCEYCGEKGTYASITLIHDKTCPKKILPCPNSECSSTIQRQYVEEHIATECGYTVITCKYKRIGCDIELKRKDMVAHEQDSEFHFHMAMDMIMKLEGDLKGVMIKKLKLESSIKREERLALELEKDLEDASYMLATLKYGEPIIFKLTDYTKKRRDNAEVKSPSYYIYPNGYCMAIHVHAYNFRFDQDAYISVSVHILNGRYDAELKWPFVGKITIAILNQLEDQNHYQKTAHVTAKSAGRLVWEDARFITTSQLDYTCEWVNESQYLENDALYFRMSVQVTGHKFWLE